MVFPIWQVWEYSIISTQHFGGSGKSKVQNYNLGGPGTPKDGNFGFPDVCEEELRLKVTTAGY